MPGHTIDAYKTPKNVVQDLIDSGTIDDLEKRLNVKTNTLPKYRDIPHTENKSLRGYPTTSRPPLKMDITSSRPHESHGSDGALAS